MVCDDLEGLSQQGSIRHPQLDVVLGVPDQDEHYRVPDFTRTGSLWLSHLWWVISDKLQTSDERPDLIFCLLAFWHSMSCLREWQRVISHCTLKGYAYLFHLCHIMYIHPRLCMISGYEMGTPQMYVSKCWRPKNFMKMVDSSATLPFPGSLFWNIPELFLVHVYNIQCLHWDTVSFHIKSRWHTSNDDERDIERSPGEGITSMKPS